MSDTDARWWRDDFKGRRHEGVLAMVRQLRNEQGYWLRRALFHQALYTGVPITSFAPSQYSKPITDDGRPLLNLIKGKVDTYVSLITRSKPKPMFLSSDGGWAMRRKAKGLDRWFEGKYYELDFFDEVAAACVLDTAVFDYGVAHTFIANEVLGERYPELLDVGVERVMPWELVFDEAEALAGAPRRIYRRKWMDRYVLAEMFPKARDYIRSEAASSSEDDDYGREYSDQILTVEAWSLKSGPKSDDGVRVICIPGKTLHEARFDDDELPFPMLYRQKPQYGMRGHSIVHELRPAQVAVNEILSDVLDNIAAFGRGKWVAPRGAEVELAHLDDDVASIIQYSGPTPPQAYQPQCMSPDQYRALWDIWDRADEIIGISKGRSGGTVPTQLKSGKAIEVASDVQDGRFLTPSQRYERWTAVDVPRRMVQLAAKVADKYPKYAARYAHKTYVQVIEFKDVNMKRDEYVLRAYPANALSTLPGQRLEQLQDLFDRQLIDAQTFQYLSDFPDLESETNLANAGRELTQKLIDRFLDAPEPDDEDVFVSPEPLWPLEDMRARFQLAAANAQVDGAPDGNVQLLRRFWQACEDLIQKAQAAEAPPAPPAPPQGAAPPAGPPPMPQQAA